MIDVGVRDQGAGSPRDSYSYLGSRETQSTSICWLSPPKMSSITRDPFDGNHLLCYVKRCKRYAKTDGLCLWHDKLKREQEEEAAADKRKSMPRVASSMMPLSISESYWLTRCAWPSYTMSSAPSSSLIEVTKKCDNDVGTLNNRLHTEPVQSAFWRGTYPEKVGPANNQWLGLDRQTERRAPPLSEDALSRREHWVAVVPQYQEGHHLVSPIHGSRTTLKASVCENQWLAGKAARTWTEMGISRSGDAQYSPSGKDMDPRAVVAERRLRGVQLSDTWGTTTKSIRVSPTFMQTTGQDAKADPPPTSKGRSYTKERIRPIENRPFSCSDESDSYEGGDDVSSTDVQPVFSGERHRRGGDSRPSLSTPACRIPAASLPLSCSTLLDVDKSQPGARQQRSDRKRLPCPTIDRYGKLRKPTKWPRRKKCLAPDCPNISKTRGFCKRHGGGERCDVEGCTSSAKKDRRCIKHGGGLCKYKGCTTGARHGDLCILHGRIVKEAGRQPPSRESRR